MYMHRTGYYLYKFNNMDESKYHYAEWKKPDKKWYMLYYFR